jgi:hypothetical protein
VSGVWDRFALLDLWAAGVARRTVRNAHTWDELARLPWTALTGRRRELVLRSEYRGHLEALLDKTWSGWRDTVARLRAAGLEVSETGLRALVSQDRVDVLPATLPHRLNEKTAASLLAPHSKATLPAAGREALADVELTSDGVVRMRPPRGLTVRRGHFEQTAAEFVSVLGELVLVERAFLDGTGFGGKRPRAILLVENVGVYVDITAPDGWLVAHVPGWDTSVPSRLLEAFRDVPIVHFGDLDPNGVRIVQHLQTMRPDVRWFVPERWRELVVAHGLPCEWPEGLVRDGDPALVRELATHRLWLEQERLVLEPWLSEALEAELARPLEPQASNSNPATMVRGK